MEIRGVDPRGQTWGSTNPAYRVYFHDEHRTSDEYEVRGASGVTEVLEWAESARGDRSFVLYACVPRRGLGLVRLHGTDPNEI